MSSTMIAPPVNPNSIVPGSPAGIDDLRIEFDLHLKSRYPKEAISDYPRPMVIGATWPVSIADVGINHEEVWDPDDGVVVVIPAFKGMAVDDWIIADWSGKRVPAKVVAGDVSNQYLTVIVPSAFIKEKDDAQVKYYVTRKDSAGLYGTVGTSQVLIVKVRFGQPGHVGNAAPVPLNAPTLTTPAMGPVGESDAKSGVQVTIAAYTGMAAFDTLVLYWGHETVEHSVQAAHVGKPIVITVPEATVLAAGDSKDLEVDYYVVDEVGNESEWSVTTRVQVAVSKLKFAAPTLSDLEDLKRTIVQPFNLDIYGSRGLEIKADPGNFQPGDTVTVKWKATTEAGLAQASDLGTVDITAAGEVLNFTLSHTELWGLANGSGSAYYEVKRNNTVTLSQSATLDFIGTRASNALPAVSIDGAESVDNGWWTDSDLAVADLVIPKLANLVKDDVVDVVMRGVAADGRSLGFKPRKHRVTKVQVGSELRLRLDGPKFLLPLEGGYVDIYYTVKRGKNKVKSLYQRFYVGYLAETLPAPTTETDLSGSNNVLDPCRPEFTHGVYIALPDLSAVKGDYTLQMIWKTSEGGRHEQSQDIDADDTPTSFQVPAAELKLNGNPIDVVVYYIVFQANTPGRASADLEFTIATPAMLVAPLDVSQAPMVLRGGAIEMCQMVANAWAVIPPKVNGNIARSQQRLPTGGTPPYTYASSAPAIARVDADGRVWPLRNGDVTITITDVAKKTISYPVQVSYCFRVLIGPGSYNLVSAERFVSAESALPVNDDLIPDLRVLYGAQLPLNRHTWTGHRLFPERYNNGPGSGSFYHVATKTIHFANSYNTNVTGAMAMKPV
ncbi:hypothetical protein AB7M33_004215 [Pseudomonas sp. Y3 TE3536]